MHPGAVRIQKSKSKKRHGVLHIDVDVFENVHSDQGFFFVFQTPCSSFAGYEKRTAAFSE